MNTPRPSGITGSAGLVGGEPGGIGRQAHRTPTQRQPSNDTHCDDVQRLRDALVQAGHTNVPPVQDHPRFGRVMILPRQGEQEPRTIRCEEVRGRLCWRWIDGLPRTVTVDPIAPVTDLKTAARLVGIHLDYLAGNRQAS